MLLQRTPYNKETGGLSLVQTDTFRAVRRGYAVVIQDCRGRYRSDGDFSPFLQEIADGYDAVEWCGSQSWSDGNVGMYGTSYVGATQWLAAIAEPPSLRAIAPAFTASDYYELDLSGRRVRVGLHVQLGAPFSPRPTCCAQRAGSAGLR